VQLSVIAAMFLWAAIKWPTLPDRIPVHWSAAGVADGYAGKFVGLLLPPAVTLAVYLTLRYLPRIDPVRPNYSSFAGTYLLVRVAVVLSMAFSFAVAVLAISNQGAVPRDRLEVGVVAVLFVILGGAMGKFRPNWFVGIRTPWTLSSKVSWVKTHRVGGRVFVGIGLATLIVTFIGGKAGFYTLVALTIAGVVYLVVYSYVVWRGDPEKVPAQDTGPADDS
jgi:immunity protein, SdpI family